MSFIVLGREIYSKVVRNNKEISFIGDNKYYDFNYQYINYLPNEISIIPVNILYLI